MATNLGEGNSVFKLAELYLKINLVASCSCWGAENIYIYIYILSSTDRLFRCIITLQCGYTRRTLEAGIETRKTFVRLSIRPLGQQAYHVGKGIIRFYAATAAAAFICLHFIPYRIPEYSICSKSFALCERQPNIYIYIYIYIYIRKTFKNYSYFCNTLYFSRSYIFLEC